VRASGVPRGDVFLTSKAGPGEMGFAGALRAAGESLRRLSADYLDLYLLHWPGCARTPLASRRHRESRCPAALSRLSTRHRRPSCPAATARAGAAAAAMEAAG
jgi:diketogulonate reductase-like aldo/keto reductase